MRKERLDKLLVTRELAATREKAQALIMAGKVRVNDATVAKAGSRVPLDARLSVEAPEYPYVSRGGVKLEAALRAFGLDPSGLVALDIGAATGGFTHCLLLHGAARVFAVDVGYGQLAWELRNDPRVVVRERTNIRHLPGDALGQAVDLAVVDVSFISLNTVLRHARRFLKPGGQILALVKPQFEAGRGQVRRGGRVTDPAVHDEVQERVEQTARGLGLRLLGRMASPIEGKKSGNREFLMLWQADPALTPTVPLEPDAAPHEGGESPPGDPHPHEAS
ncbi:MAG: TlyA family RNA methyltransferase [Candidatus Lambdaproteobacteria bacterium]|nr:TlyA family RNA methyltransferase [Candidatus Lambdaproteobacteria bacterium]